MRVGIIGRGFGERVVAGAFAATEGCEVVDVVTPRDAAAVDALCARDDVDLISVHSPPFLHVEHVRTAVAGGHAVLCDKPFGVHAADAAQMCDLAVAAGVHGFLNFEMRYDAARRRLRELVADGVIGVPEHVQITMLVSLWRSPPQPYGWKFDDALGGGWLRSMGSHTIDFVRWMFGEIVEASGQLRTAVTERSDADGTRHRGTADDGFVAMLRTERDVTVVVDASSAAPVSLRPTVLVAGSLGMLEVHGDQQIDLHTDAGVTEVFAADSGSAMVEAQRRYAAVVRDAVRDGVVPVGMPTFADGLAWNQVLERLRR